MLVTLDGQAIAAPRDSDGNPPQDELRTPDMTHSNIAAWAWVIALGLSTTARAADFYVAVDGADSNSGTLAAPFKSLPRAEQAAEPPTRGFSIAPNIHVDSNACAHLGEPTYLFGRENKVLVLPGQVHIEVYRSLAGRPKFAPDLGFSGKPVEQRSDQL